MTDAPQSALTAIDVLDCLPHRYPFLLVDRVETLADTAITALKSVSANEPFFQGHFPGHPVMPGVLIVESLAQAGAILMLRSIGAGPDTHTIYFLSIDNAKFRKPVTPGDRLRLKVNVHTARRGVFKFSGQAFTDQGLVTEANFVAKVIPL